MTKLRMTIRQTRLTTRLWALVAVSGIATVLLIAIFLVLRQQNARRIVYLTMFEGESSIAILDPNSVNCSNNIELEIKIPDVQDVRWTSDNQILFLQQALGSPQARYWLLNPTDLRSAPLGPQLQVDPDKGEGIQVSPSLQYIAVKHQPSRADYERSQLEIVDVQTGLSNDVMTGTLGTKWSPFRDQLAVERLEGKLDLILPSGDLIKEYRPRPWIEGSLHILDEGLAAFASSLTTESQVTSIEEIYYLDLQTGQTTPLTRNKDNYYNRLLHSVAWSPNKRYVAFVSNHTKLNGEKAVNVLYILDTLSGQEFKIADHVEWADPVWDSESQRIAFISTTPDNTFGEVFVYDVVSKKQTELTCDRKSKKSLSW